MTGTQLRGAFETLLDNVEVRGEGVLRVPGLPVPPIQAGDMQHDAATDYDDAAGYSESEERFARTVQVWIRRAAHAEVFARALEAELEKLRGGN